MLAQKRLKEGLGPGHIVLDGDPAPFPQKRRHTPSPISAHVYCGQTPGWIKMLLGTKVGLSPGHIVLDADPAPLPKKGAEPPPQFSAHVHCDQTAAWIKTAEPPPQFSAHIYCGQMAGCIKMSLHMDAGLSPGDCVRWGPSSPPLERHSPPIFGQCPLWPNGLMD